MKDIIKKPLFWIIVIIIIVFIILWVRYRKCVSSINTPMGQQIGQCNFFTGNPTKMASGGNVNPISQRVNCKPGDQPKWVPANNVWGWLGWSGHWSCQTIPSN